MSWYWCWRMGLRIHCIHNCSYSHACKHMRQGQHIQQQLELSQLGVAIILCPCITSMSHSEYSQSLSENDNFFSLYHVQIHPELSLKINLQHLAVYNSRIFLHWLCTNVIQITCTVYQSPVTLINVSSMQGVYAFIIVIISKIITWYVMNSFLMCKHVLCIKLLSLETKIVCLTSCNLEKNIESQ